MGSPQTVQRLDRTLGFAGLSLAVAAVFSTTQRIEVSGDAEVMPAITGLVMLLWLVLVTARHLRVHRGGCGRGWLVAGWVVLGVGLVWSVFQAQDTAAFDEGIWHGLRELATGPPIVLIFAPLVLCSVAILRDAAEPSSTDATAEPGTTISTTTLK